MNPARMRELDREGEGILALIDAIPRGAVHDMTGHLDAKRAARTALRTFLARLRNELPCGEPAKAVFGQSGKTIFPDATRRRPSR